MWQASPLGQLPVCKREQCEWADRQEQGSSSNQGSVRLGAGQRIGFLVCV
jgi:hypothetical protein